MGILHLYDLMICQINLWQAIVTQCNIGHAALSHNRLPERSCTLLRLSELRRIDDGKIHTAACIHVVATMCCRGGPRVYPCDEYYYGSYGSYGSYVAAVARRRMSAASTAHGMYAAHW